MFRKSNEKLLNSNLKNNIKASDLNNFSSFGNDSDFKNQINKLNQINQKVNLDNEMEKGNMYVKVANTLNNDSNMFINNNKSKSNNIGINNNLFNDKALQNLKDNITTNDLLHLNLNEKPKLSDFFKNDDDDMNNINRKSKYKVQFKETDSDEDMFLSIGNKMNMFEGIQKKAFNETNLNKQNKNPKARKK